MGSRNKRENGVAEKEQVTDKLEMKLSIPGAINKGPVKTGKWSPPQRYPHPNPWNVQVLPHMAKLTLQTTLN